MADGVPPSEPHVRLGRRYVTGARRDGAAWVALVGVLVYLVYARTAWLEQADQAHLREWLDESRVFRKTLPDLAGEYVALREQGLPADDDAVVRKAEEIAEQLQAMGDPSRMYQGYLAALSRNLHARSSLSRHRLAGDPLGVASPAPAAAE